MTLEMRNGIRKEKLVAILVDKRLETLAWAAKRSGNGGYKIGMGVVDKEGKRTKKYFPQAVVLAYYQNKYPGSDVRIELRG